MTEWIEESNFEFGLPEGRYFRFETLEAYEEVKADGVKEVDFVWVQEGDDPVVWLLEVKNVRGRAADEFEIDDWIEQLVQALTDAFIMMSSAWSGSWWGERMTDELDQRDVEFPSTISETRVAVAFALEGEPLNPFLASNLGDRLRNRLKGRVRIFQPGEIEVTPVVSARLGSTEGAGALPIEVRT